MRKHLDLYCKAGGASMGFHLAGFEVTGVDIKPQPRYPFKFIQADALEYLSEHWQEYDSFSASPPCQRNSTMTKGLWKDRLERHPELIAPTRTLFIATGKPYVIENVPGAPLLDPTTLCGSMFSLKVRRHRLFECSFPVLAPSCNHKAQGKVVAVYGHSGGSSKRDGLKFGGVDTWKTAMQIDWMTGAELAEAIPPAYTYYISQFLPKEKRMYRCLWHAEGGTLQKGIWTTLYEAKAERDLLISHGYIAWVEDEENNKETS